MKEQSKMRKWVSDDTYDINKLYNNIKFGVFSADIVSFTIDQVWSIDRFVNLDVCDIISKYTIPCLVLPDNEVLVLPPHYKYVFNYVYLAHGSNLYPSNSLEQSSVSDCCKPSEKCDLHIQCNGDFIMCKDSLIGYSDNNRTCKKNYVGMKLKIDCKGDFVMLGKINASGYTEQICYGSDGGCIVVDIENEKSKCHFSTKQMSIDGGNQIVRYHSWNQFEYKRAKQGSICITKCNKVLYQV